MRRQEEQLEQIVKLMRSDTSVDAPADAILYAKNLFRTRAAEAPASLIDRVIAVLRTDLMPGVPAFGERSAASGQARQMLFEAGDNAVDLRVTRGSRGYDLRGQVLGEGFENGQATLTAAGKVTTSAIDASGSFSFTGLPAGECSLTIAADGREITINTVTLQ